jgi:hypothetical protein
MSCLLVLWPHPKERGGWTVALKLRLTRPIGDHPHRVTAMPRGPAAAAPRGAGRRRAGEPAARRSKKAM